MPEETTHALSATVREIEAHAAESGGTGRPRSTHWCRPPSWSSRSPRLPDALGLTAESRGFTPIDQELPADAVLEDALGQIMWPDGVVGCAAVVERLVLPPSADEHIPEDREAAASYAAEHPERQELRMVGAALRDGTTWCAYRFRSHDDPSQVVTGPDLVPPS
jgi:hypothetical protein